MQFSKKTRKSQKQSFFSRIKVCYCSNIVYGLFDPTSTITHFLGGLHLCTFCDLNSYYYTNAIFQKNKEELETKFLCKNKRFLLFNIVSGLFNPSSTIRHFSGGLHLYTSSDLNSYYYTNAIFQENQEGLETKFLFKNKGLLLF